MPTLPPFRPGFRLSIIDCIVLVLGSIGAWWMSRIDVSLGLAVAFTVGHFFLFCNVVRMSRPLELVWTAIFVALALLNGLAHLLSWNLAFSLSLIATCVLVGIHLRSPSYHGVFWQLINPELPAWWERNRHQSH